MRLRMLSRTDPTCNGNCIPELIPWKTDDVLYSPMFLSTPQQMLRDVSQIIDKYGLLCGLWYPMMEKDYTKASTLAAAKAEWKEVFGALARLDAVQIPAGDPGKRPPTELVRVAGLFTGTYPVWAHY